MNSFKALRKEELKQMSDNKKTKIIKKGDVIFKEGERLSGVFCVRNGISKLSKMSDNGRDQIVKLAQKGEVLGQRSVIASETANLSATALEDMEVCFIPKNHIEEPLQTNPVFTNAVLKHMAQDLKYADDIIVNMAQKTVRQRLAEVLMYLEDNFGLDGEGYLYLQLSRADIADVVGTATELLIRTLTKFKKESLVSTSGKRIKIEDKKALYNIVEGL
ncbi:Crp/Fnr family transcriptional regulator [Patiriisocius hiemis]|uniref:Crp/Fnr family transcriptional regulator n=1 Tax=Patiriisocius hiemis TaxID=3075604 RepID=A0ABU2YCL8_9FLAO|nr:Crp/Fnr family transcriptional regulator [Constantimarinum sp. W242]MDT0555931.1 Crp/Fnr family transcriptional regulator [Constantimarinum sp. W242]